MSEPLPLIVTLRHRKAEDYGYSRVAKAQQAGVQGGAFVYTDGEKVHYVPLDLLAWATVEDTPEPDENEVDNEPEA